MMAALAIAWRLRYVILTLALIGAVWGAYKWFTGVIEERDELRVAVEKVEAVNRENTRVMKELRLDMDMERQATEKSLKRAAERLAVSQKLIREMRDVPGANDPVSPYWAEYFNRLRENSDRAPSH